jgi:hypothetical protein
MTHDPFGEAKARRQRRETVILTLFLLAGLVALALVVGMAFAPL